MRVQEGIWQSMNWGAVYVAMKTWNMGISPCIRYLSPNDKQCQLPQQCKCNEVKVGQLSWKF